MKVRFGFLLPSPLFAVLSLFAATPARSSGIDLSWNDCGTFGTANQSIDCAASGTPLILIASFVPPAGIGEFLGLSSELEIAAASPVLPDWWKHGSGQCRGSLGLAVGFDFTSGPSSCSDVFAGTGMGGLAYDVAYGSPSTARLRVQGAIPYDNRGPIEAGTEYYAYKLTIARGSPSCAGCQSAMCVVLKSIQIFQPPEASNDPEITHPVGRSWVTWQSSGGDLAGCSAANSVGSRTWGQLKTLYR